MPKNAKHAKAPVKNEKPVGPKHPLHPKIQALVKSVGALLASAASKRHTDAKQTPSALMLVSVDEKGIPKMVEAKVDAPDKVVVQRPFGSEREFARTILGSKPVKAQLLYLVGVSGAGAAALATVWAVDPSLTTTWSSWSSLFDLARCDSAEMQVAVSLTSSVSGNPIPFPAQWALAYDPADSAAFSAVSDPLLQTRHIGPLCAAYPNGTTAGVSAHVSTFQAVSRHGMAELHTTKLPRTILPTSATTAGPVGGEWFSTTTITPIVGWYKIYAQAPGASFNWTAYGVLRMNMEFKFQG